MERKGRKQAMAKKLRTQAMRMLDVRKIPYTVHVFPDTIRDAAEVAAALDMPPAQVFKTLVLLREDEPLAHPVLVMIPANCEVDLRALARAIGAKSARMATYRQAEQLTGLRVGGISALALRNHAFEVYIDESALSFEQILVSGGQRGVDLQLRVEDLVHITQAQTVRAVRCTER
jgi:Cys-tRNA(Pro)/Cys-tRNA(Cys) deacylase